LSATVVLLLLCCTSGVPVDIPVDLSEVTRVHIEPLPEGPPAAAFTKSPGQFDRPLAEILPYIPQPLPAPIRQICTVGGSLTISLSEGRQIVYGPCKRPLEIERLWWHYLDIVSDGRCRPDCWAGNFQPPGERVPPDISPN
jgi:hypothetical protein